MSFNFVTPESMSVETGSSRQIRRLVVINKGYIDVNVNALLDKTTIESALSLYFEITPLPDSTATCQPYLILLFIEQAYMTFFMFLRVSRNGMTAFVV